MIALNIDNRPKIYTPALASAFKELDIPNPTTAAIFVNQLSYWLNTKSGFFTKDGEKYIYNTYKDWQEQFPCMSESQIGRMVRALSKLGIIVKESFADLKRRLVNKPSGFQEYNRTSWMSLCVDKIIELGIELGYNPEALLGANLQSCSLEASETQHPNCANEFSTIYTKKTISIPDEEIQIEKEVSTSFNTLNNLVQEVISSTRGDKPDNKEQQNTHEDNTSESSEKPKRRTNKNIEDESRDKYEWEIAVGRPYPVFLQWWADTKYKPQEGHWRLDAEGNAYSEFYNNRGKTTAVTYPKFLKYMQTVTESCNQVQQDGRTAILPTCFVPLPEASKENTEAVMGNIKTLVERGAAVLLPTNSTTPTSQSISYSEATGASMIKPLLELKHSIDVHELRRQYNLNSSVDEKLSMINNLLQSGDEILVQEALKFAYSSKFNAECKDGIPVRVYKNLLEINISS